MSDPGNDEGLASSLFEHADETFRCPFCPDQPFTTDEMVSSFVLIGYLDPQTHQAVERVDQLFRPGLQPIYIVSFCCPQCGRLIFCLVPDPLVRAFLYRMAQPDRPATVDLSKPEPGPITIDELISFAQALDQLGHTPISDL